MAVQDHGLEAIRKSAEEVTSGDKSDYLIKVRGTSDAGIGHSTSSTGSETSKIITATPSIAAVGAAAQADRKTLEVTPKDGTVFWGYTSGVTTTTGHDINQGETGTWTIGPNMEIYLVSAGSVVVAISEAS